MRNDTPNPRPPLSPPCALVAGLVASLVFTLVAVLVWHSRWPDPIDAEVMRWQEAANRWGDGPATAIAVAVGPLVGLVVVACAVLAQRARRWDAVVLALGAAPSTLVIEQSLKQVVHRQRPDGGDSLLYPSGHVAAVSAAGVTAVLVLRATSASRRTRVWVAWAAAFLVIVVGVARLVQTVHYATDVVGGAAVGIAVTCWAALVITMTWRFGLLTAARSRTRDPPA